MEKFIKGLEIRQNRRAVAIGVPPRRINEIVHGKRGITVDTALRLERCFDVSAGSVEELMIPERVDDAGMVVMTPLAGHEGRLRLLSVIAQVQPESFAIESA